MYPFPPDLSLANFVLSVQAVVLPVSLSSQFPSPSAPGGINTDDSMSGSIPSRSHTISNTHESVTGRYDLYDSLHITTASGSVNIIVNPQPADPSSSAHPDTPAELYIKTDSGSIRVETAGIGTTSGGADAGGVPNRTYIASIQSSSGTITASLLHGRSTRLSTASGTIAASLYPFTNPSTSNATTSRSDITSSSTSGTQTLHLHPSLNFPHAPIRNLFGDYRHQSGSLRVTYPLTWQGTVEGSTASGSIGCEWPGLRVTSGRSGGNKFSARTEGDGDGVLTFRGQSGSVRLRGEGGWVDESGVEIGGEKEEKGRVMVVQGQVKIESEMDGEGVSSQGGYGDDTLLGAREGGEK